MQQIQIFWSTFETEFINLWNDESEHTGMMFNRLVLTPSGASGAQSLFMCGLLRDTLGFAGMKMLRHIVGIAHVEDLESLEDLDVRAKCERHGLEIAKTFIKTAASFTSIDEAIALAKGTGIKESIVFGVVYNSLF